MNATRSGVKVFIFSALIAAIGILSGIVLAEVGLRLYKKQIALSDTMTQGLTRYDSELGWRLTPGWHGEHKHKDFSVSYSVNNLGMRAKQLVLAKGRHHTLVMGDSFAFGIGVNDGETFVDILNTYSENQAFSNIAVPGYSTDQEYLALKEWLPTLKPQTTLLAVYLGNDLLDNPSPYPMQAQHGKPYFKLNNQTLQLNNVPVPQESKPAATETYSLADTAFGINTAPWYHYFKLGQLFPKETPYSKNIKIQLKQNLETEIELFKHLVIAINHLNLSHQSQLKLLLIPSISSFRQPLSHNAHYQRFMRDEITLIAKANNIPLFDFLDWGERHIEQAHKWYHPHEGHLNSSGHAALAGWLKNELK